MVVCLSSSFHGNNALIVCCHCYCLQEVQDQADQDQDQADQAQDQEQVSSLAAVALLPVEVHSAEVQDPKEASNTVVE